jgi:hypothetical protein
MDHQVEQEDQVEEDRFRCTQEQAGTVNTGGGGGGASRSRRCNWRIRRFRYSYY